MPSEDLILNVRQINGYPPATSVIGSDAIVIQRGGLGGPYMSVDASDFVGTALAQGGDMAISGALSALSFSGGSAQLSNASINLLNAPTACIGNLQATTGSIGALSSPSATFGTLNVSSDMQLGGIANFANAVVQNSLSVGGSTMFGSLTVNQTLNAASLSVCDLTACNLIVNGKLAVPSADATVGGFPIVTTGNIANSGLAPLNSPAFTGNPTAPTPPIGPTPPTDNSNSIATTAFVVGVVNQLAQQVSDQFAPINSPAFTGIPTALTAVPGTSTGQLATTAFVMAAVTASTTGVSSFNTRTGAVTLELADITGVGGAPTVSPVFTGSPTAPTPATGNSSQLLATTAFVANTVLALDAGVLTFNGRSGAVTFQTSDITGAGGALASDAGVSSFNGRTGAITLTPNDVSAAGAVGANSPALTGIPTAPTATPSSLSNTQIATTAFVQAAIAAAAGVSSFNTRTGAVTLTSGDVNAPTAGGPYLPTAGGTVTGPLTVNGAATFNSASFGAGTVGANVFWIGVQANGNRIINWSPNWYDAWVVATGLRAFYSAGNAVMTLDGSGNLVLTGGCTTANLGATIGSIGGVVFSGGGSVNAPGTLAVANVTVSNGLIPGGNNIISCGVPGSAWFQVASYNFVQESDPTAKKDVGLAPAGALAKVMDTKIFRYRWLGQTSNDPLNIGWMADDVARSIGAPVANIHGKDPVGVNLGQLLATLWQAVQELTSEVAALKARTT
jgi:hypothetical protein